MTDKIDTGTAAIKALMDGVTPGPWQAEWPVTDGYDYEPRYVASTVTTDSSDTAVCVLREDQEKDASFIAASRELVPALAAERDAYRLRAEQAYEQLKKLLASQHYSYIGKDGKQVLARELEDERDALRAENERLRELLAQVPSAINSAFSAGIEEREGGSARRQAKLMEPVDKLRDGIRSALAAWRAKQ